MGGYPESTFPWSHHAPDTAYHNYQSYQHFPNWWNQYYYQQAAYDVHYDPRQAAVQADNVIDGSSASSFGSEKAAPVHPLTTPYVQPSFAQPTTFTTDPTSFLYPSCQQVSHAANAYPPAQQLPIRPVPQQAVAEPVHQCKACLRCCSSAGGLKRHAKFCRASQSNVEGIFASFKEYCPRVPEANQVLPFAQHFLTEKNAQKETEATHPINLSSTAENNPSSPLVITLCESPPPNTALSDPVSDTPISWDTSSVTNISNDHSQCNSLTPSTPSPLPSPFLVGPNQPNQVDDTFQQLDLSLASQKGCPKELVTLRESSQKQCQHCSSMFSSERALVEHLTTHNVEKPYSCSTCGGHFSRKFHLTRHVKQRGCGGTPRAQFPCEFCGKVFSRKDNLREHIKGHTGQGRVRPKIPCPIPSCDKEFLSRIQLHTHLNFHTGQRPYLCTHETCNKSFRSSAALRKHVRVHTSNKLHQCYQCKAQFAVKENLDHHLATHLASQPEDPVSLTFVEKTVVHEQNHVGQKDEESYSCTLCRRRYRRRWRLQQHYRLVHCEKTKSPMDTTDKNETDEVKSENALCRSFSFVCDICQKGFISRQSLKVHYLTHPVDGPINCPECHKGFMRRECLLRHLRSKHRMPTILAIQAIQAAQVTVQQDIKVRTGEENGLANDMVSCSTVPPYSLPFQTSTIYNDTVALEANIVELLGLLVDSSALKNFGWPERSVDSVLQAVLIKCGREPAANENKSLIQRLRLNVKHLFSFIVDDQAALETLFERRSIDQVLEQVIKLAKSNDNNNNVVQIPI